MTHRERVLKTFRFEQTDRVPYDLMENGIWPELMDYFRNRHSIKNSDQIYNFLDTDFRWLWMSYQGNRVRPVIEEKPKIEKPEPIRYTIPVTKGPLAEARTIADIESYNWPDPAWWTPPGFAEARQQWPDHAIVFATGWMPLFWSACSAFGMEEALVNMLTHPKLFDAFVQRQHEFTMDILARGLKAGRSYCDICWLGDDFSGQKAMLMKPDLWRKHIKPYLSEQVRLAREHEMYVLYHSCGAVRPILPDLIDIGVNGLLVFQTTAEGMDVKSIAHEFGGRLAFYGGIDVQQLLSYGTVKEVKAQVKANIQAFAECGGYIVANSHWHVNTIRGENIEAMCQASREN